MIERAMASTLALCILLPAAAVGQQDPALVGEGAQVWAANCTRCHNARSSTERTDAQWAAIVGHMRVRANMTQAQARAVLAYLQATNFPEGASGEAGGRAAFKIDPPDTTPLHAAPPSHLRKKSARRTPPPRSAARGSTHTRSVNPRLGGASRIHWPYFLTK